MNAKKRPKKTTKFMVRMKSLQEKLHGTVPCDGTSSGFSNLLI